MLKWVKRIFLGLLVFTGAALLTGFGYEQWSRWSIARDFQPNGEMFEVGGRAMHLHCSGSGEPTVILESGLSPDGSLTWVLVQPEISKTHRVCSYDRAGILWSDTLDEAPTANNTAERLQRLLSTAGENPPYVLVGHSLGGPLTMVYADRYRQEVEGIVFVDSSHPEQMQRFPEEAVNAMPGPPPALVTRFLAESGLMRLFRSGPFDGFPEEAQFAIKRLPQTMPGIVAELDALETILGEAGSTANFGEIPLIVLTAGKQPEEYAPGMTPELADEMWQVWSELQVEHLARSTNSEHRVIDDAGHYIQFDNPDAVIRAIRDVLNRIEDASIREAM